MKVAVGSLMLIASIVTIWLTTTTPVSVAEFPEKPLSPSRDFFHAAYKGDVPSLRQALDQGVRPNTSNPRDAALTPLMYAAWGGQVETIRFLIEQGADVNQRNSRGATALMLAAYANKEAAVQALLEVGANPDIRDNNNNSALGFAVLRQNTNIIRRLAAGGDSLNIRGRFGRSPISYAAAKSKTESLRTLLSLPRAPSVLNLPDSSGKNALMLAVRAGCLQCVRLLVSGTSNANVEDKQGKTALDFARGLPASANKTAIISLLSQKGARVGKGFRRNRSYQVPPRARRVN